MKPGRFTSQLRRLDLTLLLVFLGLMRHRKALDVAGELGLTQSAISQALKRLRDIFEDDLFLRRPHGMEPTAVALSLETPVAQAVEALRGALGAARSFDPATASGIVRVSINVAEMISAGRGSANFSFGSANLPDRATESGVRSKSKKSSIALFLRVAPRFSVV